MSLFIHHTLMMLEDAGMSVQYPEIRSVKLHEDGKSTVHTDISIMSGKRVSVEQNHQMKFLMIFALLDFYVDAAHPAMEGKSYHQKYKALPTIGDFDLMLRQLFRLAKVMRNALVHNPSSFNITNGHINVSYDFRKVDFSIEMSMEALANFYTAIVMYLKGDIGRGSYFLGLMRSIYSNLLAGTKAFSDEFGNTLENPSSDIKIKSHTRLVCSNPQYQVSRGLIRISVPEMKIQDWEGLDFHITHNGDEFLIPQEALNADFVISEHDLVKNWKREGRFPQIKKP